MEKDSKKRKKMAPYEYVMLLFALLCAGVIAIVLSPAYLVPKFRPTLRAFFEPLKRFLPGAQEEEANNTQSPGDSDLPRAFRE